MTHPCVGRGMKAATAYYVWLRSDGYVGATTYDPRQVHYPNHTFEVLLVTQDWPAAHDVIRLQRETGDWPEER